MNVYQPFGNIYGVDPSGDQIAVLNPTDYSLITTITTTVSGRTVENITGLAYNHISQEFYGLFNFTGVTGSNLCRVNVSTGVCTEIGNMGGNDFSALIFDLDGNLYAVTAETATPSETIFTVNTSTAAVSLFLDVSDAVSSVNTGEQIDFNISNGFIYHWTGSNPTFIENIDPESKASGTASVTTTTYSPLRQIFGSLYLDANTFLLIDALGTIFTMTIGGLASGAIRTFGEPLSGLARAYIYGPEQTTTTPTKKKTKKTDDPRRCLLFREKRIITKGTCPHRPI